MTKRTPRSNTWIWYFVTLFVLTVSALTTLVVYNLRQQLKPEQLEAALRLWQEKFPHDYDLRYTVQSSSAHNPQPTLVTYEVTVRTSEVVDATLDGHPIAPSHHHSMTGLFADILGYMKLDAEKGRPRTFTIATFDARDGHVRHYIRRVGGSSERVEIIVQKFEPVGPAPGP